MKLKANYFFFLMKFFFNGAIPENKSKMPHLLTHIVVSLSFNFPPSYELMTHNNERIENECHSCDVKLKEPTHASCKIVFLTANYINCETEMSYFSPISASNVF